MIFSLNCIELITKNNMDRKITSLVIPYILLGIVINTFSLLILGLLAYFNPKTYYGNEGYNNGLIVLLIYLPMWILLLKYFKGKKNWNAIIGIGLNMIINIIFYIIVSITG